MYKQAYKILRICLLTAITVVLPKVAKSDDFFDKGYVTGSDVFDNASQDINQKPGTPTTNLQENNSDIVVTRYKATSVGLIVDGTNSNHVLDSIKALVKSQEKYKFKFSEIFLLISLEDLEKISSNLVQISDNQAVNIAIAKLVRPGFELPAEYKDLKRSPTWIINTKEGQVLVEGVFDIEKYLE